jgi:5-methyltetrahydropteroyltriglutamate--homocysteine methyltransferase
VAGSREWWADTVTVTARGQHPDTVRSSDPEVLADLIRRALEYVPPERLILSSDCGFGREGLSRRIAFSKAVAINLGAIVVRREVKLPEVDIPAADPRYTFSS